MALLFYLLTIVSGPSHTKGLRFFYLLKFILSATLAAGLAKIKNRRVYGSSYRKLI